MPPLTFIIYYNIITTSITIHNDEFSEKTIMKAWHKIILIIIIAVGIFICVKSCVDKREADITLAYIGDGFLDRDMFDRGVEDLNKVCGDINGDNAVQVDMMEISFNESLTQSDIQNSRQKLTSALGAGVARVYFIEEKYLINNAESGIFADMSQFGSGFKTGGGKVVAISLKGNEKAQRLGIDTQGDIYIALRDVSEMDTVLYKDIELKNKAAENIVKYILS